MRLDYVKQIDTITDINLLKNHIIETICFEFNIGFDRIVNYNLGCKNDHDTYARQLICYYLYVFCKLTPTKIGHIVNRERKTVHWAVDYIDKITEITDNERFYIKINIENKIRGFLSIGISENKVSKESELKYKMILFLNSKLSYFNKKFGSRQQILCAESNKRLIRNLINEIKNIKL